MSSPTTVRLNENEKAYLALHGDNTSDAIHRALRRLQVLTGRTPPVRLEEGKALCGCCNGSSIMLESGSGPYLQYELEDYPACNPIEAGQFDVDYQKLAARAASWGRAEQAAVILAVEAVFADDGDLDALVRRHFTVTD